MLGTLDSARTGTAQALRRDGFGWMEEEKIRIPVPVEAPRGAAARGLRVLRRLLGLLRAGRRPAEPASHMSELSRAPARVELLLDAKASEVSVSGGGTEARPTLEVLVPSHVGLHIRHAPGGAHPKRSS